MTPLPPPLSVLLLKTEHRRTVPIPPSPFHLPISATLNVVRPETCFLNLTTGLGGESLFIVGSRMAKLDGNVSCGASDKAVPPSFSTPIWYVVFPHTTRVNEHFGDFGVDAGADDDDMT